LVGDLIKLKVGMKVDCDGILAHGINVTSDESSMTGESKHLKKIILEHCDQYIENQNWSSANLRFSQISSHPSPVIVSGSTIVSGEGYFICIAVGDKRCKGKILDLMNQASEAQTPLQ